jgi:hypothetical protein
MLVVFGSMILGHPQRFLRVFGFIGFLLCAYPTAVAVFGLRADNLGHVENVAASVRENPASYRPVSIVYVGYRPYTSASSSSGGYSGGK